MEAPSLSEIRVNLPGACAPTKLPAGWSRGSDPADVLTIISAESDLRVAFVGVALAGTTEESAGLAWRLFDSGFDFPVRQKMQMPGSNGWDAIFQIVYNVPAAESRSAVAILRTFRDEAYITLVLGKNASLSRRFAQISELLVNWKPEGLSAPSLANSPRRAREEKHRSAIRSVLRRAMAEQRLAEMKEMKPTTGFGETFQYSNYLVAVGGYAAAHSFRPQALLEDAYEEAMRDLVFEPLGMNSTTFDEPRNEAAASPHSIDFDGRAVLLYPLMEGFASAIAPSGAAWSTVIDMAQYLLIELNGGKLPNAGDFLREEPIQARWSGGIKINEKMSYGLGLLRGDEEGLDVLSHGGNTLGVSADLYFLPTEGVGVAVLTNLRAANLFLAAVHKNGFQLLFDAQQKAEV